MNLKKLSPRVAILSFILVFTVGMQIMHGWNLNNAVLDFMTAFLFSFGVFKVLRLRTFTTSFASYDFLTARSRVYAHVYPFVELALGLAYYLRWQLVFVNWIALAFMLVSIVSVFIALGRKQKIGRVGLDALMENFLMLAVALYILHAFSMPTTYTIEYDMEAVDQSTVDMTLVIKDGWGQTVTDFDTVHEREMHLIGVRTDLRKFLHVHPDMASDGVWQVQIEFPTDGPYQFYADFTPTGGEPQILTFTMSIGEFVREKLGFYEDTLEIDGYQVTYHFPDDITTGDVSYSLSVSKDEQPVTNFENYLGAKGHSVVIHQDSMEFQHVHALEAAEPSFVAHFEDAGTYAVFTQIQVDGNLLTVPFVIQVEQGEEVEEVMEEHMVH